MFSLLLLEHMTLDLIFPMLKWKHFISVLFYYQLFPLGKNRNGFINKDDKQTRLFTRDLTFYQRPQYLFLLSKSIWTLSLECKAWVRFKVFSWAWSCKPLLYPPRRLRKEAWNFKATKLTGELKANLGI